MKKKMTGKKPKKPKKSARQSGGTPAAVKTLTERLLHAKMQITKVKQMAKAAAVKNEKQLKREAKMLIAEKKAAKKSQHKSNPSESSNPSSNPHKKTIYTF